MFRCNTCKKDNTLDAYELFQNEKVESLVPVVEFSFPPLRGFSIKDGKVKYKWPEFEKSRSQDLDKIYHDAGQFYICSVKSLIDNNTLVSPNTVPFILDELEVQDIDTEMDWKLAELKYKLLEAEK